MVHIDTKIDLQIRVDQRWFACIGAPRYYFAIERLHSAMGTGAGVRV